MNSGEQSLISPGSRTVEQSTTDRITEGSVLVIVPCGRSKIWSQAPEQGPIQARLAYTGGPFVKNRAYAERFGDAWVLLSAKYGFISPTFLIPRTYEVTFKRPATGPIATEKLMQQVRAQQLDRFDRIIGLGGKEYRAEVSAAFAHIGNRLEFPFAGLPVGKSMQAVNRALLADSIEADAQMSE